MLLVFAEEVRWVAVLVVLALMGVAYFELALCCLEYSISASLVSPAVVFAVEGPRAGLEILLV